ncbi:beta-ketoacyl synthase N-terminal-like domain-containing protein [Aquimarina intermedia]|uniref:3-oxoacyl-[acyl-carrier-protein] synthase-1 n=1 Tax=Aquimarina intermedia TaxID=350814 RepID=A0A5S5C4H2_9FLAO|nr:beta-ketoacyl synthase N-terminal-like domain-containing protein [Aquimarina intermedia]TYP74217.1 3-oxoacyl-[acyl-carrier-protein] synthase-1 [Aquimarina intermedia]
MKSVYIVDDSIISPLGFSVEENLQNLKNNTTGIVEVKDTSIHTDSFYGGLIDEKRLTDAWDALSEIASYTKLEKMMLLAMQRLLDKNPQLDITRCGVLISTTKGNIDQLKENNTDRAYLDTLASAIQQFYKLGNSPTIISNACISGGLAIAIAKRMIQAGHYEDVIVVGGDLLSEFTLSGFFSFQAVSPKPCKPFSKNRTGISLGEAAAATWISGSIKNTNISEVVEVVGEASANDANHISGPSRTGEGLYLSIQRALDEAKVSASDIDYISAHGTATPFNDEMESIAFSRSGLEDIPVNSLKGYYGHTLGASALLETIIAKHHLLANEVVCSLGFDELGVSYPIDVIKKNKAIAMQHVLKTASGFGGCNVALVLKKVSI